MDYINYHNIWIEYAVYIYIYKPTESDSLKVVWIEILASPKIHEDLNNFDAPTLTSSLRERRICLIYDGYSLHTFLSHKRKGQDFVTSLVVSCPPGLQHIRAVYHKKNISCYRSIPSPIGLGQILIRSWARSKKFWTRFELNCSVHIFSGPDLNISLLLLRLGISPSSN